MVPKLLAGRRWSMLVRLALAPVPDRNAPSIQLDGATRFRSAIEVRWMPALPTYPTCRDVLRASSRSTERFHCQLFGTTARGSLAALGDTAGLAKGEGVSRVRVSCAPMTNGALCAKLSSIPTNSRWKNCPIPARIAVLPSPFTSQATPMRGAMLWLLLFTRARLDPGVPLERGKFTPRV